MEIPSKGREAIRREIINATADDIWRACIPIKYHTSFREAQLPRILARALDAWETELNRSLE